MLIRRIYRAFYRRIICRSDPLKYAKKIGVNIKGNVKTYGNIIWGTEPWMITLGDNVHLTDGVHFLTHEGAVLPFHKDYPTLELSRPITVGNNVYIGNNVMILYGVIIGNNVTIGCGSIITKDIPDNSVVVGVPGRVIKTNDDFLEKLKNESSGLGDMAPEEKDIALRKLFNYTGNSKGIYF